MQVKNFDARDGAWRSFEVCSLGALSAYAHSALTRLVRAFDWRRTKVKNFDVRDGTSAHLKHIISAFSRRVLTHRSSCGHFTRRTLTRRVFNMP